MEKQKMSSWKQPVDTAIFTEDWAQANPMAATLYLLLLIRATNENRIVSYGETTISLKRGQAIFGRNGYARYFGLRGTQSKKVERRLHYLKKVARQVAIKPTNICTIVTILNYDKRVRMTSQVAKRRPTNSQSVATNESVKSEKSVKKVWLDDEREDLSRLSEAEWLEKQMSKSAEKSKKRLSKGKGSN